MSTASCNQHMPPPFPKNNAANNVPCSPSSRRCFQGAGSVFSSFKAWALSFALAFFLLPLLAQTVSAQPTTLAEWSVNSVAAGATEIHATGGDHQVGATLKIVDTSSLILNYANAGINRAGGFNGRANQAHWYATITRTAADPEFENIRVTWSMRSSNTGPRDFKLQYSADGTTWLDAVNPEFTVRNNLPITHSSSQYSRTIPDVTPGTQTLHIRWLLASNLSARAGITHPADEPIGAGGTNTINNIVITREGVPPLTYTIDVTDPAVINGGTYTFAGEALGYASIAPTSFTIENTGTGDITNLDVELSGADAADFDLDKALIELNTTLNGGDDIEFEINPKHGLSVGTHTATVTITGSQISDYWFTIIFTVSDASITGGAINITQPVREATPEDAAAIEAATGSPEFDITAAVWTPNDATFAASTIYSVELTLTAKSGFTFDGLAAGNTAFTVASATSVTNTATADGGATITVTVTFPETAANPVAPTITSANNTSVQSGAGGTFQVTATGTTPITYSLSGHEASEVSIDGATGLMTIDPSAGTQTFTITATNGAGSVTQTFTLTVLAIVAPMNEITASPVTASFGSVTTGYAQPSAQTITITNTGINTIILTQPTATNYDIGTLTTTTIAGSPGGLSGGTATFTIQPKAGLPAGVYNETITVSGTNGTSAAVAASFTVTAPIAYTVTYNLNLGTGTVPTETDKTAGETFYAADLTGITAPAGQMFREWNTAADGSGTAYAISATVTMPAGDLTLYAIWMPLPPTYSISASPSSIAFGTVLEGYTQPAAQTVTITNTGTGAVTLVPSLTIPAFFDVSPGLNSLPAHGSTSTFTARPKPSLPAGVYNETLTINAIDANSQPITPATIALSFTVLDPAATITSLSASPARLSSSGGNSVITVSGTHLSDGIRVTVFDGATATSITGTTTGSSTSQTVTLSFPANTSAAANKVYTIMASLDGGTTWAAVTATVTAMANNSTAAIPVLNPVGLVLLALALTGMAARRRKGF